MKKSRKRLSPDELFERVEKLIHGKELHADGVGRFEKTVKHLSEGKIKPQRKRGSK